MLKRLFLAVVLTLALSFSAFAADNGFYLGLKFIDSIQSTGDVSKGGGTKFFDVDNYTQNTIGGGVFAGYDFYPMHQIPVRAEIEYAIRTNSETDWDSKVIGALPAGAASLKGQWNLQTLFLNAYWDFHNDTAFTPYIGGGIGMGFIQSKYEVNAPGLSDSYNETNTVFAWNAGAGVAYAITDNLSADLAYRFVGLDYHENDKTVDGQKFKVGMAPYANEFSLGIRYTF
ncbi:outer membrane beta-barrel protein [Desulfovibrio sp. 86]|uniref:Surface antigen msp4 family protein n=1 Tax=uncultured Desulfovibrio sp. TaxID=167968 RepID=A0A212KZE9_9BACT|nr:outer membrane beta-barrel protein [Desulfovibrio sp. 86]SCM70627.1 Surface antigen msp4 family protein [uncultured Desulfovibrio sp.]VZH32397.1 Surface antigen msp4 family protein [Desulfovibrio sp. 86]